ncbi:MAG TPA: DUF4912 domain-containing protein [Polyangiaceae bacterium]|jgi:hypothetical protein
MTRAELERLDRDALITRAEGAGVTRARILTRPELVDELLLRTTVDPVSKQKARGFFGVARDLLARVVERGLNLPDAADRIRTLGGPLPSRRSAPAALPTLTLAEIYATQGHRSRAIETLEGVLTREPDHAAAHGLLTQLRDDRYPVPPPRLPPEDDEPPPVEPPDEDDDEEGTRATLCPPPEPMHMLDDAPLPPHYDVDECVAIPVDPRTLYVYWEARASTLAELAASHPAGALTLRLVVVVPTWDGPQSSLRDHDVAVPVGDFFARDLPPGAVVRVALGWKTADDFAPIAHSPALEIPADGPSPLVADTLVRWTPQGAVPVRPGDRDAAVIERALGLVRRDETLIRLRHGFLGSSDRWMHIAPQRA